MNIQFKKGVLDIIVLSLLQKKDMYGYDISDIINKKMSVSAGTVYPILRKMKDEGLVSTYLSEDSSGPPRKYYQITKRGSDLFVKLKKEWLDFMDITLELLEGDY